jgi:hypothetical protein
MLEVKFRIPPLHPSTVRRARLVEQVRVSGCRVVGVTAPAGYGKSTFLAEWARIEDRRVAWLSLDRFDDDPGTFLGPSAAAYGHIDSDRADLVEEARGIGTPVLSRAAPRLAAAFAASPASWIWPGPSWLRTGYRTTTNQPLSSAACRRRPLKLDDEARLTGTPGTRHGSGTTVVFDRGER